MPLSILPCCNPEPFKGRHGQALLTRHRLATYGHGSSARSSARRDVTYIHTGMLGYVQRPHSANGGSLLAEESNINCCFFCHHMYCMSVYTHLYCVHMQLPPHSYTHVASRTPLPYIQYHSTHTCMHVKTHKQTHV